MTSGSGPLFTGPEAADWQTVAVVDVASQPSEQNEPGGRGADFGKSSPVGLLVLLLFFIAVAFLVRSMTKHLKRVPASFDEPADASGEDASGEAQGTDGTEGADESRDARDPEAGETAKAPAAAADEKSAENGGAEKSAEKS